MIDGVEERLQITMEATGGADMDGAQRSPEGEASRGGGRINPPRDTFCLWRVLLRASARWHDARSGGVETRGSGR